MVVAIIAVRYLLGIAPSLESRALKQTWAEAEAWIIAQCQHYTAQGFFVDWLITDNLEKSVGCGFTQDEQDAIAEQMTMEQDLARRFARRLTEGDVPIAGIRYEEEDEPVHTYESPFCDDPECPCHCGHIVDGRIIGEQEVL